MKQLVTGVSALTVSTSALALVILSIANTVTSEFLSLAVVIFAIGWLLSYLFQRHYRDFVRELVALVSFFLLYLNILYSRVIVAPGGENNGTMSFLYLLWGIEFIFLFRGSVKTYQLNEDRYKDYLIARGAELMGETLDDD